MRETRNPLFVFTLSLLTLGFYNAYWHFQVAKEIRSFGGDVPSAWLQFIPLVNVYFFYRFIAEAVAVIPTLDHSWLHFAFHITLPWFSAGLVQHRVNEHYEEDVQTNSGTVPLEKVVEIVDKALDEGHDQAYVTKRLRDKGISDHYINEAYRIENKRNGYT